MSRTLTDIRGTLVTNDQAGERLFVGWLNKVQDPTGFTQYLRKENGESYDTLIDYFSDSSDPITSWAALAPGNVVGQDIEPFRKFSIVASNLNLLSNIEGGHLFGFPFSMFKQGRYVDSVFYNYGPDDIDAGFLYGCTAENLCFDYAFGVLGRIENVTFKNCTFRNAILDGAVISGTFENCTFEGAYLRKATLRGGFKNCSFKDAIFGDNSQDNPTSLRGTFDDCVFTNAEMYYTSFSHARMINCDFQSAKIDHPDFNITATSFIVCDFRFSVVRLSDEQDEGLSNFYKCSFDGATIPLSSSGDPNTFPNMFECNFVGADIAKSNFVGMLMKCNFTDANFRDGDDFSVVTHITETTFAGATGMDTSKAELALKTYKSGAIWTDGSEIL